jgi:hypothetical protein
MRAGPCHNPIVGVDHGDVTQRTANQMGKTMIRHTVVFSLKHSQGSAEEKKFLEDALILASIPTVRNFERLKQVSRKNGYKFGFSMEFDDQAAYDTYDSHPTHVAFVRDRWQKEVSEFMEIDYVKI